MALRSTDCGGGADGALPALLDDPEILVSQVLNGMLLPVILIFMLLLIYRKKLMNEWINPPLYNVAAWTAVAIAIDMTSR